MVLNYCACLLLYLCFYDIFLVLSVIYLMQSHNQEGSNQCLYYIFEKRLTFIHFSGINFGEKWRWPMCETGHICCLN